MQRVGDTQGRLAGERFWYIGLRFRGLAAVGAAAVQLQRLIRERRRSMRETWVRPNRRPMILGTVLLVGALAAAGWLSWLALRGVAGALIAGLLGLLAAWVLVEMTRMVARPILAYENGELLVFMRGAEPHRIPIDSVECFLRGQGPARPGDDDEVGPEANNIVVRLAEAAAECRDRDVNVRLGHWCDGYITLRGMWCEPIDLELLRDLNARLAGAHRQRRSGGNQAGEKKTLA